MTKRSRPLDFRGAEPSPEGSLVFAKSRFRWYSASWPGALRLEPPRVVAGRTAPYAVGLFFGFAGLRPAATDFLLARTAPFFPLPSSRLARRRDIRSRTPLSGVSASGSSSRGFFPFIFALITFIRLRRYSSV